MDKHLIILTLLCWCLTTSFSAPTPSMGPTCSNGEKQYKNLMNDIATLNVEVQNVKLLNDVDKKVSY